MEKTNIAELLKGCPTGMELDCVMLNNPVTFYGMAHIGSDPIMVTTVDGALVTFTKYGQYINSKEAKCVIFPKGKTTWEGFVPPCKFKDGDIIADEHGNIAIYKGTMWYNKKLAGYYCGYRKSDNHFLPEPKRDGHFGVIEELHHATEEEKEKLFQVIKDNGYKWNAETKALEKLVKPIFKAGDTIQDEDGYKVEITKVDIDEECYVYISTIARRIGGIPFEYQDKWELAPNKFDITTLIPFESRVLVRDFNSDRWKVSFWGCLADDCDSFKYDTTRGYYKQCIPYEGNEHLLGKADDCIDFYKNWE